MNELTNKEFNAIMEDCSQGAPVAIPKHSELKCLTVDVTIPAQSTGDGRTTQICASVDAREDDEIPELTEEFWANAKMGPLTVQDHRFDKICEAVEKVPTQAELSEKLARFQDELAKIKSEEAKPEPKYFVNYTTAVAAVVLCQKHNIYQGTAIFVPDYEPKKRRAVIAANAGKCTDEKYPIGFYTKAEKAILMGKDEN